MREKCSTEFFFIPSTPPFLHASAWSKFAFLPSPILRLDLSRRIEAITRGGSPSLLLIFSFLPTFPPAIQFLPFFYPVHDLRIDECSLVVPLGGSPLYSFLFSSCKTPPLVELSVTSPPPPCGPRFSYFFRDFTPVPCLNFGKRCLFVFVLYNFFLHLVEYTLFPLPSL